LSLISTSNLILSLFLSGCKTNKSALNTDELYMHRCLELARMGIGNVAPNPMVGSVLVYQDRIIGEGYHMIYGQAHAEVNCINSVKEADRHLIPQSTLYVSLEPCAHYGKTPPCADLIIKMKIPRVVVGCRDPFIQVDGKGIERLIANGIDVKLGVLENACIELNKRFFTFHTLHRPYVMLKWAQTTDGKMASAVPEDSFLSQGEAKENRLLISNSYSNRLVHQWRSEEMAILIGTNTALADDPELTTRLWPGNNPVRLVVDLNLRLPASLKLFDGSVPTIIFNLQQHTLPLEKISATDLRTIGNGYYQVTEDVSLIHQIMNALVSMNILSVMVEGGARLLQSFIDEDLWDEARVITNEDLYIGDGLPVPVLKDVRLESAETILSDRISLYRHK
jgi:diaminohydroxyphosphoribosylaminopyrimidine deaminase/5-amino-6-(5-phosphoribosylamino)uracil reductase